MTFGPGGAGRDKINITRDAVKELQQSTTSSRHTLDDATDMLYKIAKMALEGFEECFYFPKFLDETADTLRQNLGSYMESLQMNQEFYL